MTYWRMQLHPNEPGEAVKHCVESLAAGYVGLDFSAEVGDLRQATQSQLPENQRDYWAFAHEMDLEDSILIIAHHFPFALATVAGDYNYIRIPAPEIGVWFRHFRRVDDGQVLRRLRKERSRLGVDYYDRHNFATSGYIFNVLSAHRGMEGFSLAETPSGRGDPSVAVPS